MEDESIITTRKSEVEGLIRQIRASSLHPAARDKIERLLRTFLSLVLLLEMKNTSITKLKKLIFGKKSGASDFCVGRVINPGGYETLRKCKTKNFMKSCSV